MKVLPVYPDASGLPVEVRGFVRTLEWVVGQEYPRLLVLCDAQDTVYELRFRVVHVGEEAALEGLLYLGTWPDRGVAFLHPVERRGEGPL